MSIRMNKRVTALENDVNDLQEYIGQLHVTVGSLAQKTECVMAINEDLEQRLAKLEARKKPGPKPKGERSGGGSRSVQDVPPQSPSIASPADSDELRRNGGG